MMIMLFGALVSAAWAGDISGQATVIDGDTIEIHGQRIRFWGIDAPESAQLCRGSDSELFRCGSVAANRLAVFIGDHTITCSPRGTDRYRRVVAACSAGGVDLGRWLVGEGLALDWPLYSRGTYSTDQKTAASKGIGMFAGSYIEPWIYRSCIRAGGRPLACSDGE